MADIQIYTTRFCPFCIRAKQLLNDKGLAFNEIPVDNDPALRRKMAEKAGKHTVPQIWINEDHVGGCNELFAIAKLGRLDNLD